MELAPIPNAVWSNELRTAFDVDVLYGGSVVRTTVADGDADFTDGALVAHSAIEPYRAAVPKVFSKDGLISYATGRAAFAEATGVSVDLGARGSIRIPTDQASALRLKLAHDHAGSCVLTSRDGAVSLADGEVEPAYQALCARYASAQNALAMVLAKIESGEITTPAEIENAAWPPNG